MKQMSEYNGIYHPTRLGDSTEGGEAEVQVAHSAGETEDDAVGV
jgi:hypothetical protein